MWQRFSEGARRAVALAQKEARASHQHLVTAEHLFLGAIAEPDSAANRVVVLLGASPEQIAGAVREAAGLGSDASPKEQELHVRGKRAIDLAYGEAVKIFNNRYIETEHLMLGAMQTEGCAVGEILSRNGVTLENVREAALRIQKEENRSGLPRKSLWAHVRRIFGRGK